MPRSLFVPYPEAAPPPTPPQDYQHFDTSPAMFGGLQGAAEQRAGPELAQAGTELTNTYSELSAQQEQTAFTKKANTLLYGDPNDPTSGPGLFGLTGQAYMDKRQEVLKGLEDARQESMTHLATTQGQFMFNNEARSYITRMQAEIGRGYEVASREWAAEVHKNEVEAALSDAANNYNQTDAIVQNLARMNRASHQNLIDNRTLPRDMTNANPEQLTIANNAYRQNEAMLARTTFNSALAHNDMPAAQQILQNHSSALASDPHYPEMVNELKIRGTAAIGASMFNDAQTGATGTPARGASNAPENLVQVGKAAAAKYGVPWDVFQHQIAGESGWDPNIGTSSAGAQGIAQFIPSTAAQYGVNVHDTTDSLDKAARYMADLHQQSGSWSGALSGYLTGKPQAGEITSVTAVNPEYRAAYAAARSADSASVQPIPSAIPSSSPQTPPPVTPPGMAQLSQMEMELAQNNAAAADRIRNDPRGQQNPEAQRHALMLQESYFNDHQKSLTASKAALIDQRTAAADTILQEIRAAPSDPAKQAELSNRISTDPMLEGLRYQLGQQQDEIIKGTAAGNLRDFGPGYYDVVHRMTLAPNDPNRISDFSQLLGMTQPDDTGFRWLSDRGLQQAGSDLASTKKAETAGDLQIKEAQLAAVKSYLTFQDAYQGVQDAPGMASYARFMPVFQKYWDSPQRLADQAKTGGENGASPMTEAIYALAAPYKRSQPQFQKDFMSATEETTQPAQIKTKADLAAAVAAGMSKQDAEKIGIDRGWIVPLPAQPAAGAAAADPSPPMER